MARPRGYADWNPSEESLELIGQVRSVLNEYRAQLPLTARQIFYRLVGAYGYDKTERAYSNLCEKLVRARRAGMVPFASIRDDGTMERGGGGFSGKEGFWRSVNYWAEDFELNRMNDQPKRIELWCEAAGMLPQLATVAGPYSIPCYSTGGFSSVTVTHEIAQRAAQDERETVFLHVGDYDPSGESIFEAMTEDAREFLWGTSGHNPDDLRPVRVALTAEQVEEHDLPTAPPKASDSRSRNWIGETCQAEAMPPDLLAQTIAEAIAAEIDEEIHGETLAREERERDAILHTLSTITTEEE